MKNLLLLAAFTYVVGAAVGTRAQEPGGSVTGPVNFDQPRHKIEFSISPFITKGFGSTKWVMEETGYIDTGIIGTVKSELDYPLNSLYGGFELRLGSDPTAFKDWLVKLTVGTNLNHPSNVMKDHDWVNIQGGFHGKISYTESRVRMSSLLESLDGHLTLARNGRSRFGLVGGIQYQHFYQKLYDLVGWQLRDTVERVDSSLYQDRLVGTYRITYLMPNVGLFGRIQSSAATSAELRGAFAVSFVSDEDFHLMRNRIATASGVGFGFMGAVKLRIAPGQRDRGTHPFFELESDFLLVKASPTQTIYWYGNDPIAPGDETGSSVRVSHHITSKQGHITARVGLSF